MALKDGSVPDNSIDICFNFNKPPCPSGNNIVRVHNVNDPGILRAPGVLISCPCALCGRTPRVAACPCCCC
jgi:hypothetical protein